MEDTKKEYVVKADTLQKKIFSLKHAIKKRMIILQKLFLIYP